MGVHAYENNIKPFRNYYRTYLKDAFRLALYSGRRREEIITLKFSDIITDKEGNSVIKSEDIKVNRIQKRNTPSEKKYNYIPVTHELNNLLMEMNWQEKQGSNDYILAPEVTTKRTKIMSDILTRGL